MSFTSNKYSSNLEKYYYNNIYKATGSSVTSRRTNKSSHSGSGVNLRASFAYYTKSLYSSSPQSSYWRTKTKKSEQQNQQQQDAEQTETESIISNIRRLGIESPSLSSVQNLRNLSYLQSRDHDCLETLLIQMEPTQEEETESAEKPQEMVDAPPQLEVVHEVVRKKSKLVSCFHRSRKLFILAATRCFSWISILKKLSVLFGPIDFQSKFYLVWLAIVSLAYIYNLIGITLRYSFGVDHNPEGFVFDLTSTGNYSWLSAANLTGKLESIKYMIEWFRQNRVAFWLMCDLCADLVYLIDIFLVQTRIKFIREGLWVLETKSTALKYMKSPKFIVIFKY